MNRCAWAEGDALYESYHDTEWGVPVFDDALLFEFLVLEGFQAGLSWLTILRKREAFRAAFADFDIETVAAFGDADVERLLGDPGIVRNRAKIAAAVGNARAFLELASRHGSFSEWIWSFVDGRPVQNRWRSRAQVPARSAASDALARDLKRRGFKFVGTTIMYAFMQAAGMVNDHTADCFRHRALARR